MTTQPHVIEKIPTGAWGENCYIIFNENKKAIVIDPGADPLKINSYIVDNNLIVSAILNTHGHYDHIGAVDFFQQKYSAKFYLHSSDFKLLQSANLYVTLFEGKGLIKIPTVDIFIDHIDSKINIDDFKITFIESPGHTNGSVCILIENDLFTGDTLLKNATGRVDLPGGDENTLKKSLKMIMDMPADIKVFPGHGSDTTIYNERNNIKRYLNN